MSPELYSRILSGLKHGRSLERFCVMLQNEPFLDADLVERVREARQTLGRGILIYVVTNGSLATPERGKALFEAGLDELAVSIDASDAATYEKIHGGLKYERVRTNVESLLAECGGRKIVTRFLRQRDNLGEEDAFRRYWRSRGASVAFSEPGNRAGALEAYRELKPGSIPSGKRAARFLMALLFPFCYLPFLALSVLWDGRVILCCGDWKHDPIVGDLSRQGLGQVWNGEELKRYRRLLYARRAAELSPCAACSSRHGVRSARV
jgi:MoaA/NifB/PqqE/SkfB family radical SAM enzyme